MALAILNKAVPKKAEYALLRSDQFQMRAPQASVIAPSVFGVPVADARFDARSPDETPNCHQLM
ncbi:hypothetical protein [Rhizobium sp. CAU 1783]